MNRSRIMSSDRKDYFTNNTIRIVKDNASVSVTCKAAFKDVEAGRRATKKTPSRYSR